MSNTTNNFDKKKQKTLSLNFLETALHVKPFIKKANVDGELLNLKLKDGVKEIEECVN